MSRRHFVPKSGLLMFLLIAKKWNKNVVFLSVTLGESLQIFAHIARSMRIILAVIPWWKISEMWRNLHWILCWRNVAFYYSGCSLNSSQITKFMGPTWGPPGSCRPQLGPMLAPWTLLSGTTFEDNAIRCNAMLRPSLKLHIFVCGIGV